MKSFNKAELLGNIGNDVELQEKGDTKYVKLSVAENIKSKNSDQEKTQWFDVVAFNGLAKAITENCKKGQTILVHGRISISTYTDSNEITRKDFSLIADDVVFF